MEVDLVVNLPETSESTMPFEPRTMAEATREPHRVSLKVLRLSRPSLAQHFPMPVPPKDSDLSLNAKASLDLKDGEIDDQFVLGPMLTLPPAFGAAYVGETFSCTLCANNELSSAAERQVSNIKIEVEMRAPSGIVPLDLMPKEESSASHQVGPGESLQKIVRFDLREEGAHTLAVNVTYSETMLSKDNSASGGRARSFSKLYQFPARPCLNVRTKISPFPKEDSQDIRSIALEAQLDNVADGPVTLKTVSFTPKPAFKSTSFNWDTAVDAREANCPILSPRDVMQVAFLIEQQDNGLATEVTRDGRLVLGQLSIQWRTAMGDTGFLSTGWLTTKRR